MRPQTSPGSFPTCLEDKSIASDREFNPKCAAAGLSVNLSSRFRSARATPRFAGVLPLARRCLVGFSRGRRTRGRGSSGRLGCTRGLDRGRRPWPSLGRLAVRTASHHPRPRRRRHPRSTSPGLVIPIRWMCVDDMPDRTRRPDPVGRLVGLVPFECPRCLDLLLGPAHILDLLHPIFLNSGRHEGRDQRPLARTQEKPGKLVVSTRLGNPGNLRPAGHLDDQRRHPDHARRRSRRPRPTRANGRPGPAGSSVR